MAKNETRRLSPNAINDDVNILNALSSIQGYAPSDTNYSAAKLVEVKTAMETAQAGEARQEAGLKTARDTANAKEWEFHNAVLRAKEFVVGQFGSDSNEVQAVGLKKKSEYRAPHRSGATEDVPAATAK